MKSFREPKHKGEFILFSGGLDVVSPAVSIPPGCVRSSQNFYEDIAGGYTTVQGYEPFDGTQSPSLQSYSILPFTGSGSVAIGNTITGTISGATAYVLSIASSYFIVTNVTGTWVTESTTAHGAQVIGPSTQYGASGQLDAQYRQLAWQYRANLISIVPGSGAILGIAYLKGVVYAFRANAGATAINMYKSTTSGWTQVNLGNQILFSNASIQAIDGATLTQGAVSATINRVVIQSGALETINSKILSQATGTTGGTGTYYVSGTQNAGSASSLYSLTGTGWTGTGYIASGLLTLVTITGTASGSFTSGELNNGLFVLGAVTGGNFAAGAATLSGGGSVTLSGVQTAITLPNVTGARFEFDTANFYGQLTTQRLYGCDGVNYAFEFDNNGGTDVFVPINATLTPPPKHIQVHQNHLCLACGSSIIIGGIGNPYFFDASTSDAAEIACGDNITGFGEQPGSGGTTPAQPAMAVYCRNSTFMLYGTNGGTTGNVWDLANYNDVAGAIPYSIQKIGETYVFDDRGVTSLSTTANFGNFIEATISQRVKTWLIPKRTLLTDSHIARDKQHYRMFFTDGTALYWTITADKVSAMPMYFPDVVRVSCSQETWGGGAELIYFGSDNGNVFQFEKGYSFNGQPINCYLNLAFDNSRSYRFLKKYIRTTFELVGFGYSEFNATYTLSNADGTSSYPDSVFYPENLNAANWDSATTWDSLTVWDGTQLTQASFSTPGDGVNISVELISSGNYYSQIRYSGAFIEFIPLRQQR